MQALEEHEFEHVPRSVEVRGNTLVLHALEWGEPAAPAIVFLHGGGLTAHSWDVVCDVMCQRYRCIALDLRGHGDSDWSPSGDYSLAAHASDVVSALNELGVSRAPLVGQSLGGLTALMVASTHQAIVPALALVDTGPRGSRPAGRDRVRAFMDGPREFPSVEDFVERAAGFNPLRPRGRLRRSLLHNLRETGRGTWTWKYDPAFLESFRRIDPDRRRQGLIAAAAAVTCPVLIVRGGASEHLGREDAEATIPLFGDARWVEIAGAGHTVQGDRPHELVAVLNEFLSSIEDDIDRRSI